MLPKMVVPVYPCASAETGKRSVSWALPATTLHRLLLPVPVLPTISTFSNMFPLMSSTKNYFSEILLKLRCSSPPLLKNSKISTTVLGFYALKGPKPIFLNRKLEFMRSNLMGNFSQSISSYTVRHSDRLF